MDVTRFDSIFSLTATSALALPIKPEQFLGLHNLQTDLSCVSVLD